VDHQHDAEHEHQHGPALPRLIADTLMEGRSLEAISLLAREQNISLQEARVRIDEYIEHHPEVYRQLEEMRRESSSNLTRFVMVAGIVLALTVLWLIFE